MSLRMSQTKPFKEQYFRYVVVFLLFLNVVFVYCWLTRTRTNTRVEQEVSSQLLGTNTFFIAANFKNNEDIIPHWTAQLDKFINSVNESPLTSTQKNNIYISIYESGSNDNTKKLLKKWEQELVAKGVPNRFILDDDTLAIPRMERLAKIRNRALEPLYQQAPSFQYNYVIFMNDIYFFASDLLSLVTSTVKNNYDGMCPMDYYYWFYDTLVMRDEKGGLLQYDRFPYFADGTKAQEAIFQDEDVPVFSCWNGVIVLKALPLYKLGESPFRALTNKSEDASECCLIFPDIQRALQSSNSLKVFVNPRIRVAYSSLLYWYQATIGVLLDQIYFKRAFTMKKRVKWQELNRNINFTEKRNLFVEKKYPNLQFTSDEIKCIFPN